MLYEILKSIRNFFPDTENQKIGKFTISENVIEPSVSILEGQYFLIEGSVLNDGVYLMSDDLVLNDETFTGTITPLKIPKDFLSLAAEIEAFAIDNKPSNLQAESFGGYSYTRATTASGNLASWQTAFGTRLNAWRKI